MSFQEVRIDHGLENKEVKPPKKTQSIPWPEHLFKLHTLAAFVGPRGKGKTNAATNLMYDQIMKGYFTRIYAISPTFDSNEGLKILPIRPNDVYRDYNNAGAAIEDIVMKIQLDIKLYKNKEIYEKTWQKFKEAYMRGERYEDMSVKDRNYMESMQDKIAKVYMNLQFRMEYNPECIAPSDKYMASHVRFPEPFAPLKVKKAPSRRKIDADDAWKIETPTEALEIEGEDEDENDWPVLIPPYRMKHPVACIFIDDMSHSDIYSTSRTNPLVNLSLRHRHLGGPGFGVTIYFCVQTFKTGVPKALRFNCMQFHIFQCADITVLESMYEEFGGLCSKETFYKLYSQCIGDDPQSHDFLTVDKNAKDSKSIFRKNFDTIIQIPEEGNIVAEMIEKIKGKRKRILETETEEEDGIHLKK